MAHKKGYVLWNKNTVKLTCLFCKKEFEVSPSRLVRKYPVRFCSMSCCGSFGRKIGSCELCGKEFSQPNSQKHRFCSKSCAIKVSNTGRKATDEARKNMSLAHLGHKPTEETRRKLSIARLGNTNTKGKKIHTEEHKEVLRQRMRGNQFAKGNPPPKHSFKKGIASWNKNIPMSEQVRQKLSVYLKNNPRPKSYYLAMGLKGVIRQQEFRTTKIEKIVYEYLENQKIQFEKQKLINNKFLVDAYIPKFNLIIECDGDYWHSLPNIIKKDKRKNAYLKKCGFKLIRISETSILNRSFVDLLLKNGPHRKYPHGHRNCFTSRT